jgi:hypothetical protein
MQLNEFFKNIFLFPCLGVQVGRDGIVIPLFGNFSRNKWNG